MSKQRSGVELGFVFHYASVGANYVLFLIMTVFKGGGELGFVSNYSSF